MLSSRYVQPKEKGRVFVLSAPAGTGKTTLARRLVETFDALVLIPTLTTREPRAGEVSGKDYEFISTQEFKERLSRQELVEHVELHGNLYGVSALSVNNARHKGKHALLVIDTDGAAVVKKRYDSVLIFLKPPSMEVLSERLKGRATEDVEIRARRLARARKELQDENIFDYSVVNDKFDDAFYVLSSIIIAETHRVTDV